MEDREREGAEREGGGEEEKRRVGRPRKIEELKRERRGSTGSMEDYLKRKREEVRERDEREENEEAARKNKRKEGSKEEERGWGRERRGVNGDDKNDGRKIVEKLGEELGKIRMEIGKREERCKEEN